MRRNDPFIYFVYYTARSQIEDEFHDFLKLFFSIVNSKRKGFQSINNELTCTDFVTELMNSFIYNID